MRRNSREARKMINRVSVCVCEIVHLDIRLARTDVHGFQYSGRCFLYYFLMYIHKKHEFSFSFQNIYL